MEKRVTANRRTTDLPFTAPIRIVVCADDYALTSGVSRAIRELLAARRISATSVMTGSAFWPAEAAPLKEVAGDADIGLHVTLTDQKPLGPMPAFAPSGRFPPLATVFRAGLTLSLPLAEIETEIERQVEAFMVHYGSPPAHIDGHHHMHQLPGVRDIAVRVAARVGLGHTWVRSCAERLPLIARRRIAPLKAAVIGALGTGIARKAAAQGVPSNSGFSGVYDFAGEPRPLCDLFARFLDGVRSNGLVMCHPGHADKSLAGLDAMTVAREAEHAFLMSEAWPRLLAARSLELGPLLR